MTKRLARIYAYYGKYDGEEIRDQFLIEDTEEERKALFNDYSGYYNENKEDFLSGKSDYFSAENDGGDWDDPTSYSVVIYDKDELLNKAKSEYEREVKSIERLFKEDE